MHETPEMTLKRALSDALSRRDRNTTIRWGFIWLAVFDATLGYGLIAALRDGYPTGIAIGILMFASFLVAIILIGLVIPNRKNDDAA